jgi:hypothetical protein
MGVTNLQDMISEPRLKYFMDPLVLSGRESDELVLFHSKLVFLFLEAERKAVMYIGSHNWTRRAMGPSAPRNAEASLRVEITCAPRDLDGKGVSFASDVNHHLLDAYHLPVCFAAADRHLEAFEQWTQKACKRAPVLPLDSVIVVLAVHRTNGRAADQTEWQSLARRGIYFQVLNEEDGQTLGKAETKSSCLPGPLKLT